MFRSFQLFFDFNFCIQILSTDTSNISTINFFNGIFLSWRILSQNHRIIVSAWRIEGSSKSKFWTWTLVFPDLKKRKESYFNNHLAVLKIKDRDFPNFFSHSLPFCYIYAIMLYNTTQMYSIIDCINRGPNYFLILY